MSDEQNQSGVETESFIPHREGPQSLPRPGLVATSAKSRHTRFESFCATCSTKRIYTPGSLAVGEKFFWSCAGCGESIAITDDEIDEANSISGRETTILPRDEDSAAVAVHLADILAEYQHARGLFPRFHSAHEGLGVLWEEFEELKAEVFKSKFRGGMHSNLDAMREEAIQVAAMALRFLVDVK